MLAEPVERLRGVGAEAVLDVEKPCRLRRAIGAWQVRPLMQKLLALCGTNAQVAAFLGQGNSELRCGQASGAFGFAELEGGAGAGFSRREHPRLELRSRRRTHGPRRDVDERISANGNFKRFAIVGRDEAAG